MTEYLVPPGAVRHLPGGGSRTLVAQEGDEVSVGVVLDESVGAGLERSRPARAARRLEPRPVLDAHRGGEPLPLRAVRARARPPDDAARAGAAGRGRQVPGRALLPRARRTRARSPSGCGSCSSSATSSRPASRPRARERYHEASRLANRYCGWLEARYLRPPPARGAGRARPGASGASASARSSRRSRRCTEARDGGPEARDRGRGAGTSRSPAPCGGRGLRLAATGALQPRRGPRDRRRDARAGTRALPGKDDVFDLVLAPRFARILDEVCPQPPPARVLPFRRN